MSGRKKPDLCDRTLLRNAAEANDIDEDLDEFYGFGPDNVDDDLSLSDIDMTEFNESDLEDSPESSSSSDSS